MTKQSAYQEAITLILLPLHLAAQSPAQSLKMTTATAAESFASMKT